MQSSSPVAPWPGRPPVEGLGETEGTPEVAPCGRPWPKQSRVEIERRVAPPLADLADPTRHPFFARPGRPPSGGLGQIKIRGPRTSGSPPRLETSPRVAARPGRPLHSVGVWWAGRRALGTSGSPPVRRRLGGPAAASRPSLSPLSFLSPLSLPFSPSSLPSLPLPVARARGGKFLGAVGRWRSVWEGRRALGPLPTPRRWA